MLYVNKILLSLPATVEMNLTFFCQKVPIVIGCGFAKM